MSLSHSYTESVTFTVTHARRIASKVRTDLMRIHRLYDGTPSLISIVEYETELIALLRDGYLDCVSYGFRRHGNWVAPTLQYTAEELQFDDGTDDRPGAVKANQDVSGAKFYSYLTYSDAWDELTASEKQAYKAKLPYQRTGADAPGASGYFTSDKTYSAGGRALNRSTLRSS